MPVYRLRSGTVGFPDPRDAEPDGLLAAGGDLRPERLSVEDFIDLTLRLTP